ncbi:hypothetical protein DFH09DRAFT_916772, partial [Mycena vulgaris]
MNQECRDKSIEFVKKNNLPRHPSITTWKETHVYICARQGSGGRSKYQRKNTWDRKIPSKRTGCPCRLTVKSYPGTSEVLGFYKLAHSHDIGDENLRYMRLDAETRKEIEKLLRLGVEPKKVLENITQNLYHESNIDKTRSIKGRRRDFATRADVRRIQKMIEEETIRLAAQDGPSVLEWVAKLREEGHYWGHGMPAAWMISSNGKEVTIDYFLATILRENPLISPNIFMSDFDWAQLNAIRRRFPKSRLFLCWWHVLHAWQRYFVTQHYPLLWERLKRWIRITDQAEFDSCWAEIQTLAPPSVVQYLQTTWMGVVHMWSGVYRSDRSIFETCDTNMLVEAWHHLLKGDFLEGKRNRRLDHLIHVLCDVAIPHFIARHRRQKMGFEGPDLALKHRIKVTERAESISKDDIQYDPDTGQFIVRSQADHEVFYKVDIDAYDCTCLSFPLIRFCKHICAAQRHFPEKATEVPVSSLNTPDCDSTSPDEDSDDEFKSDGQERDSDSDNIAALFERLQSLSLLLSVRGRKSMSLELDAAARASVHHATQVLDLLAIDLAPLSRAVLPPKVKIAPNQSSWMETQAVMGVQVKSK